MAGKSEPAEEITTKTPIHFRAGIIARDVAARLASHEADASSRNALVRRDAHRYYRLLDRAQHEIDGRFSRADLAEIMRAHGGSGLRLSTIDDDRRYVMADGNDRDITMLVMNLEEGVREADALRARGLAIESGIARDLPARILALSPLQQYVLLDMIERAWASEMPWTEVVVATPTDTETVT